MAFSGADFEENFYLSTGAVIGAFTSALFAYCAFEQARRQADAASADQRPWLRVTLNFGSLRFSEIGDAVITYEVNIKNAGRSPARNLRDRITARVMTKKEAINSIPEQKRQCGVAAKDSEFSKTEIGMPRAIIFPNENPPKVLGASGWRSATVTENTFADAWPSANRLGFQIIGCYDYELPSGDHGQTGFTYLLSKNVGNEHAGGFTPITGVVPTEQILFEPDPFSGGYVR